MSDSTHSQSKAFDALNPRTLTGKRDYVRSLEQRTDAEALSLLVECLCDESWFLRDLAEESLLRLGDHVAPVLVPLLGDGLWYTRASAARVLGRWAHRPAVAALLRQADDPNDAVAVAARDALLAIARGGGSVAVARALHRIDADVRVRRLGEIRRVEAAVADRIERMDRQEELMSAEDEDLSDESPVVQAAEHGLEWEVLTGPAKAPPRPPRTEGRGESAGA